MEINNVEKQTYEQKQTIGYKFVVKYGSKKSKTFRFRGISARTGGDIAPF